MNSKQSKQTKEELYGSTLNDGFLQNKVWTRADSTFEEFTVILYHDVTAKRYRYQGDIFCSAETRKSQNTPYIRARCENRLSNTISCNACLYIRKISQREGEPLTYLFVDQHNSACLKKKKDDKKMATPTDKKRETKKLQKDSARSKKKANQEAEQCDDNSESESDNEEKGNDKNKRNKSMITPPKRCPHCQNKFSVPKGLYHVHVGMCRRNAGSNAPPAILGTRQASQSKGAKSTQKTQIKRNSKSEQEGAPAEDENFSGNPSSEQPFGEPEQASTEFFEEKKKKRGGREGVKMMQAKLEVVKTPRTQNQFLAPAPTNLSQLNEQQMEQYKQHFQQQVESCMQGILNDQQFMSNLATLINTSICQHIFSQAFSAFACPQMYDQYINQLEYSRINQAQHSPFLSFPAPNTMQGQQPSFKVDELKNESQGTILQNQNQRESRLSSNEQDNSSAEVKSFQSNISPNFFIRLQQSMPPLQDGSPQALNVLTRIRSSSQNPSGVFIDSQNENDNQSLVQMKSKKKNKKYEKLPPSQQQQPSSHERNSSKLDNPMIESSKSTKPVKQNKLQDSQFLSAPNLRAGLNKRRSTQPPQDSKEHQKDEAAPTSQMAQKLMKSGRILSKKKTCQSQAEKVVVGSQEEDVEDADKGLTVNHHDSKKAAPIENVEEIEKQAAPIDAEENEKKAAPMDEDEEQKAELMGQEAGKENQRMSNASVTCLGPGYDPTAPIQSFPQEQLHEAQEVDLKKPTQHTALQERNVGVEGQNPEVQNQSAHAIEEESQKEGAPAPKDVLREDDDNSWKEIEEDEKDDEQRSMKDQKEMQSSKSDDLPQKDSQSSKDSIQEIVSLSQHNSQQEKPNVIYNESQENLFGKSSSDHTPITDPSASAPQKLNTPAPNNDDSPLTASKEQKDNCNSHPMKKSNPLRLVHVNRSSLDLPQYGSNSVQMSNNNSDSEDIMDQDPKPSKQRKQEDSKDIGKKKKNKKGGKQQQENKLQKNDQQKRKKKKGKGNNK